MRGPLRRLHRDERGQIVPLFLLGLVTFVLLVVMILNTGEEVVRRTEVQNAADAAAITQASWTARSLNLVAMNQVALTQSFTVSVVSAAVAQVATEALAVTLDLQHQYEWICEKTGVITVGLSCLGAGAAIAALAVSVQVPLGIVLSKDPGGRSGDFREIAIALTDMNAHLRDDFPKATRRIAAQVAGTNRVDPPLFHPAAAGSAGEATPLPVEDAPPVELPPYGPSRLCRTGEEGTTTGDLFGNFESHGQGRPYRPYPLAREDAVGQDGLLLALQALKAQSALIRFYDREYGPASRQGRRDNALTRNLDQWWRVYCHGRVLPQVIPWVANPSRAKGTPGARVIPIPHVRHVPMPPLPLSLYRVQGRPLAPLPGALTPQSTRDALSLVAFTRRRSDAAILPARFTRPEPATYAYAQAEVYSAGGTYDLFTQDWKARLVPARLVERRRREVERAVARWPGLEGFLRAAASGELDTVNAH